MNPAPILPSTKRLPSKRLPPRVDSVMRTIAAEHGMTISMAISSARGCQSPIFVQCRAAMCVELRRLGLSLQVIGRYVGGMHHTSVMHLIRAYGPEMQRKRQEAKEIPCPDLSGEWAI